MDLMFSSPRKGATLFSITHDTIMSGDAVREHLAIDILLSGLPPFFLVRPRIPSEFGVKDIRMFFSLPVPPLFLCLVQDHQDISEREPPLTLTYHKINCP